MTKEYVVYKITQLLEERNWTSYRLAKESGICESTLNNFFSRGSIPSIPTLMKICKGFGITMSDFFNEEGTVFHELSLTDKLIIAYFHKMEKEDKERMMEFIRKHLEDGGI